MLVGPQEALVRCQGPLLWPTIRGHKDASRGVGRGTERR